MNTIKLFALFALLFAIVPSVHAQQWVCDGNGCRIVRSAPSAPAMQYGHPVYGYGHSQPQYYSSAPAVRVYAAPAPVRVYGTPYGVVTAPPRQYYSRPIVGPFGAVWGAQTVLAGGRCGCPDCVCGDNCRCDR